MYLICKAASFISLIQHVADTLCLDVGDLCGSCGNNSSQAREAVPKRAAHVSGRIQM